MRRLTLLVCLLAVSAWRPASSTIYIPRNANDLTHFAIACEFLTDCHYWTDFYLTPIQLSTVLGVAFEPIEGVAASFLVNNNTFINLFALHANSTVDQAIFGETIINPGSYFPFSGGNVQMTPGDIFYVKVSGLSIDPLIYGWLRGVIQGDGGFILDLGEFSDGGDILTVGVVTVPIPAPFPLLAGGLGVVLSWSQRSRRDRFVPQIL